MRESVGVCLDNHGRTGDRAQLVRGRVPRRAMCLRFRYASRSVHRSYVPWTGASSISRRAPDTPRQVNSGILCHYSQQIPPREDARKRCPAPRVWQSRRFLRLDTRSCSFRDVFRTPLRLDQFWDQSKLTWRTRVACCVQSRYVMPVTACMIFSITGGRHDRPLATDHDEVFDQKGQPFRSTASVAPFCPVRTVRGARQVPAKRSIPVIENDGSQVGRSTYHPMRHENALANPPPRRRAPLRDPDDRRRGRSPLTGWPKR
jgi:hypothetical protein